MTDTNEGLWVAVNPDSGQITVTGAEHPMDRRAAVILALEIMRAADWEPYDCGKCGDSPEEHTDFGEGCQRGHCGCSEFVPPWLPGDEPPAALSTATLGLVRPPGA